MCVAESWYFPITSFKDPKIQIFNKHQLQINPQRKSKKNQKKKKNQT